MIEYLFGFSNEREILASIGSYHTNLTGYQTIVQTLPDQIITDCFHVIRKTESKEDDVGNCYDWYEIDNHYRMQDKTPILVEAQEKTNSAIGGQRVDRPYKVGEFLTVDGKLYRVKLPILVGGYITPGTNVEETDIAAELSKLNLGGN